MNCYAEWMKNNRDFFSKQSKEAWKRKKKNNS